MNYRTQTLWLPGLICMALSAGWMFLLQRTLAPGQGPWQHAGLPLGLYLLWLATLPVFGAISACLSKRQGGEQLSRIAASLFLPLVMSGFWIAVTIYVAIRMDGRPLQWAEYFSDRVELGCSSHTGPAFWCIAIPGGTALDCWKRGDELSNQDSMVAGTDQPCGCHDCFHNLDPSRPSTSIPGPRPVQRRWVCWMAACSAILRRNRCFFVAPGRGAAFGPPRSRSVSSHRDGCSGWVPDADMPDRVGQTSRVQLDPRTILWDGPARRGALAGHHTVFDCVTIWKYALSVVVRDGLQICLS